MKKSIMTFVLTLLFVPCAFAMNNDVTVQEYRNHPEKYADFRLTRKYGQPLRSYFDILPKEVVQTYIQQHLARVIAVTCKQKILHHHGRNNQNKKNPLWNPIPLEQQQLKIFSHHDGNYSIVPNLSREYACWDGNAGKQKIVYDKISYIGRDHAKEALKDIVLLLSKSDSHSKMGIYCREDQYKNNNQTVLYRRKNGYFGCIKSPLSENIKSSLLNNDGSSILICSNNELATIVIDATHLVDNTNIFLLKGDFVASCAAHSRSLFAVCSKKQILLIDPQFSTCHTSLFGGSSITPECIEFSPADKYLYVVGGSDIWLLKVKISQSHPDFELIKSLQFKMSSIRKAFFISDTALVIALSTGQLLWWTDFNELPDNRHINCCRLKWRPSNFADNDDKSPVILLDYNNNLVFILDPADYQQPIPTFVIRKASTGHCLAEYSFSPYTPKAMGLTKDETKIIFMDDEHGNFQLDLYDEHDLAAIDFITNRANWYQLCYLRGMTTKIPLDQYVPTIQSWIKSFNNE